MGFQGPGDLTMVKFGEYRLCLLEMAMPDAWWQVKEHIWHLLQVPEGGTALSAGSTVKSALSSGAFGVSLLKEQGYQHLYLREEFLCWLMCFFSICSGKHA